MQLVGSAAVFQRVAAGVDAARRVVEPFDGAHDDAVVGRAGGADRLVVVVVVQQPAGAGHSVRASVGGLDGARASGRTVDTYQTQDAPVVADDGVGVERMAVGLDGDDAVRIDRCVADVVAREVGARAAEDQVLAVRPLAARREAVQV